MSKNDSVPVLNPPLPDPGGIHQPAEPEAEQPQQGYNTTEPISGYEPNGAK